MTTNGGASVLRVEARRPVRGEVPEWSIGADLKSDVGETTVGSNPTLSAVPTLATNNAAKH